MQYMLMIYAADGSGPAYDSPEFAQMMKGYRAFSEEVKSHGAMIAGDALQGVDTATTVRVRDNATTTTDGPFAETKEQLGGYYLLECADLDAAIAYAAKIPSAKFGAIEIRPVMVFD